MAPNPTGAGPRWRASEPTGNSRCTPEPRVGHRGSSCRLCAM